MRRAWLAARGWGLALLGSVLATGAGATGDLAARLALSAGRLDRPDYAVAPILAGRVEPDWPGDVPGRLILGWTALAEATGHAPPALAELVQGLPAAFNAHGYLGLPLDLSAIDEQQLSGHGWLISGLCRYSAYSGDPRPLAWVRRMIQELALPLRGHYRMYPRTPDDRNRAGGAGGRLTGRVLNGWKLSTDVGCSYIFLEGLVAAYQVMPSPALAQLIDEAGAAFLATDVVAVQAQTHAALCAARNLLLYDERSGFRHGWRPQLEAFYHLYRTRAMTENEANWNWFGRPTWTEPCAIVDSFLLATELWRVTGQPAYLEDAHRIFYNGLGYGQKTDGGFGCDAFNREGGQALSNRHWDVPWCCNMRGAVGLAGLASAAFDYRPATGVLVLPFYADGPFRGGGWRVVERTGWPLAGTIELHAVREGASALRAVAFFVPAECPAPGVHLELDGRRVDGAWHDGFVTVAVPAGADRFTLRVAMDLPLRSEPPHNAATSPDLITVRYGYLLLGTPDGQTLATLRVRDLRPRGRGRFQVGPDGPILAPLCDMPFSAATAAAPWRTQVLFRIPAE